MKKIIYILLTFHVPARPGTLALRFFLAGRLCLRLITFRALCGPALLFSGMTFDALSQQPTQEWVARYQSPTGISGVANKMALDKVGNCYVFGEFLNITNNVILIKYNSSGDSLWTRKFQNGLNSLPHGVITDSIGNSYITFLNGANFGPYDIMTAKYDPNGVLQWMKTYNSGGNDEPRDIAMDRNGNVYIAGFTGNQSLIIKYNPAGDTLWTRKYNETNYRFPVTDLILDNQNNIYICGVRVHTTNSSAAQFTIKYDSSAVFKWINSPLVTQMPSPVKLGVDNNGNVFVTGRSFSSRIMMIKYDSSGTENWQRIYNGPGNGDGWPFDLKVDLLGNIIITGANNGVGTGSYDFVTIKYNTNGDSLWVRRYNGTGNGNDESYSLELDDSNNAYITGRSFGSFNEWDYTTIKYNSIGVQQWITRYPSLANSSGIAYVVKLDKNQNVYVTGKSDSTGTNDYVTIKYSQPVGINPISTSVSNEYKLEQNYPNPFNPVTKIKYYIMSNAKSAAGGQMSKVKLTVFDVNGKEIAVLVNQEQKAGVYEVTFEPGKLSSGVYFYKLSAKGGADNYSETKKLVFVK